MIDDDNDKIFITSLVMIFMLGIALLVLSMPSLDDSVDMCVDQTGWSADRCRVELLR